MTDPKHRQVPIWHPHVHRAYDERLVFYGADLTNYLETRKTITPESTPADAYEVYGDRDLLLRCHGPQIEHDTVSDALRECGAFNCSTFTVTETLVISGQRVKPLPPHALSDFSLETLKAAQDDWSSLPESTQRELLEKGVVLGVEAERSPADEVRAFSFIGARASTDSDLMLQIADAVQSLPGMPECLRGLYVGLGEFPGSLLVELAVPTAKYGQIIKLVRLLHRTLRLVQPRTQTYVVGDTTFSQADRCAFRETFPTVMGLWMGRFPGLGMLQWSDQLRALSFLQPLEEYLFSDPTRDLAREFAESRVALEGGTSEDFRLAVVHLGTSLERLAVSYLGRAAKEFLGSDWRSEAQSRLGVSKPPSGGWTLGDALHGIESLSRQGSTTPIGALMNDLWLFMELRNAATHPIRRKNGRTFDSFEDDELLTAAIAAFRAIQLLPSVN